MGWTLSLGCEEHDSNSLQTVKPSTIALPSDLVANEFRCLSKPGRQLLSCVYVRKQPKLSDPARLG